MTMGEYIDPYKVVQASTGNLVKCPRCNRMVQKGNYCPWDKYYIGDGEK